jgi:simple sugar transport system substrate-binding protein
MTFISAAVGSDEYSAGRLTAQGLIDAGVQGGVFCGVHMPGDGTLIQRSEGLKDRLAEEGIETNIAEIPFEPGQAEEYLTGYLRRNPDTGAIVTLDSRMSVSSRGARQTLNRTDLLLAGFDLDLPTLRAIRDGEMLFTIDQQQFWRGYMPVLAIVHNIRYGLTQANYFLSGPNIVDASNVEKVLSLVEKGYR